jgi:15-cis-phytoene desaturase
MQTRSPRTVAIIGGGVAGLSAAHELAERGFQVTVYEAARTTGGKARSIFVPGTGSDGRRDLPGEHGFRFFPSFYRHLPDTMRRIPFGANPNGVADNLVATSRTRLARIDAPPVDVLTRFPNGLRDIADLARMAVKIDVDLPREDLLFAGKLFLTLLTSCQERRFGQYEHAAWWDFVQADRRSAEFRKYFCDIAVRSLVAMCPRRASTRTTGVIGMQIWLDHARPGSHVDRLLNGPTHDVWITPWRSYLEGLGVRFEFGCRATRLNVQNGRLADVRLSTPDGVRAIAADYYVAAIPVERMAALVSEPLKAADPRLAHLDRLHTEWMNGIQFFLDRETPLVNGHLALVDAPWALTAIAQKQFWPKTNLANFGDGRTRDVLSVIISNWDVPGAFVKKPARECTRAEIQAEVWAQLKAHRALGDVSLVHAYLADSIEHRADGSVVNHEPLLINTAGSWAYRPEAVTRIANLFLAADYVRTNTDIATMESANEAARRAVNGILDAAGASDARCGVWDLDEPSVFKPLRALDRLRLQRGQPHLLAGVRQAA